MRLSCKSNFYTTIGSSAFFGFASLALTHLPPNLTTIGRVAFMGGQQLLGGPFEAAVLDIFKRALSM